MYWNGLSYTFNQLGFDVLCFYFYLLELNRVVKYEIGGSVDTMCITGDILLPKSRSGEGRQSMVDRFTTHETSDVFTAVRSTLICFTEIKQILQLQMLVGWDGVLNQQLIQSEI